MSKLKTLAVTVWCFAASTTLLFIIETYLTTQTTVETEINPHPLRSKQTIPKNEHFLNDLKYLETSQPCIKPNQTLAIFIVTSYVGNVATRSAIRRSIPSALLDKFRIKRVFLLGMIPRTDRSGITQSSIASENERFGDLVQGDFLESYRNLTLKHLMGLKWGLENCGTVEFIAKMDDDTVMNVYGIHDVLTRNLTGLTDFMAGYVLEGMLPKRDPANKWYVTYSEYKDGKYPTFLSGWFYITVPRVVEKLLDLSNRVEYFWIDDAFITGMLRSLDAGIGLVRLNGMFTIHSEYLDCCVQDMRVYRYKCETYAGPNGGDQSLIVRFYGELQKCLDRNDCVPRPRGERGRCVVGDKEKVWDRGVAVVDRVRIS